MYKMTKDFLHHRREQHLSRQPLPPLRAALEKTRGQGSNPSAYLHELAQFGCRGDTRKLLHAPPRHTRSFVLL
ncbi:hypothetical protein C0J52_08195 [Blattella germanica]|nr:hypothetical protein C0J52_08195 [Blattella germanica]